MTKGFTMKMTIEATDEITFIEGIECRTWRGTTEGGHPVDVFICRVSSSSEEALRELKAGLAELPQERRGAS
jgi:hypothetical protein